jgi:hypothetical protein
MGILGMILSLLGIGVSLVFGIILLIQAFKESHYLGLGLFIRSIWGLCLYL